MTDPTSEANLVQRLFAPLTLGHAGAFGLQDDVAFLPAASQGLIVTQDQVIEGTHFLLDEPLDMIARRLVRRNLSDMIAKGGTPTAAFLNLAWPKSRARTGMAQFARGLGEDLDQLCGHCPLMGGDTSVTSGYLVASLTMLGTPTSPRGGPILRRGARAGDVIAVTGVIGDSYLGLQARLGLVDGSQLPACIAFSLAPFPPDLALASLIGRFAHASIDVSDGLILDASYIAKASGVAVTIMLDKLPLSNEARQFGGFGSDRARALVLASGGDDYQPLIALPDADFIAFQEAANQIGVRVTQIGTCVSGEGVTIQHNGDILELPSTLGWQI